MLQTLKNAAVGQLHAVPWHQPSPISHTSLSLAKQQKGPLSGLKGGGLVFRAGLPPPHNWTTNSLTGTWAVCCGWTEGLFSRVSQAKREKEKGEERHREKEKKRKRERERTVCCGHWLLQRAWAPCQLRLWALIKKENLYPASGHGGVGLTGASSWSLPAHTSWDSSLQTPTEWVELGSCPMAFTWVCHLPVNCQVLLIPSVPFLWRPKQQHGLSQWQPREVNNGRWTSSLGKGPLSA